jgi:DNA adenine methylase
VLRDEPKRLLAALELTPWSRQEYDQSHIETGNSVEDARRFMVRCWQAHASDLAKKTGWKHRGAAQRAAGMSHRWNKLPDQLWAIVWRLKDAEIECRDALDVISRFNVSDCLIYADPPYLPEIRTQSVYAEEMTADDHKDLLAALVEHSGPVVLSGYASALYDDTLAGWRRITLKPPKVEAGSSRTEVLWVNHV